MSFLFTVIVQLYSYSQCKACLGVVQDARTNITVQASRRDKSNFLRQFSSPEMFSYPTICLLC